MVLEGQALLRAIQHLRSKGTDLIYIDQRLLLLNKRSGVVSQPTRSSDAEKQVSTRFLFCIAEPHSRTSFS